MIANSKTITFMVVMAGIEAVAGGLHFFELLLTPVQFSMISFSVGIITSMGGVYLRIITTQPLKSKT